MHEGLPYPEAFQRQGVAFHLGVPAPAGPLLCPSEHQGFRTHVLLKEQKYPPSHTNATDGPGRSSIP